MFYMQVRQRLINSVRNMRITIIYHLYYIAVDLGICIEGKVLLDLIRYPNRKHFRQLFILLEFLFRSPAHGSHTMTRLVGIKLDVWRVCLEVLINERFNIAILYDSLLWADGNKTMWSLCLSLWAYKSCLPLVFISDLWWMNFNKA